jgi:CBS domain-containing protein
MHTGIVSCHPDMSLTQVARLMVTYHVHCIGVIGISHDDLPCGVWGVISDLDLVGAGIEGGGEPTARSFARQPLVTVGPGTALREAARLMLAHRVSHLVVIESGTERPIGILSTMDVAGVLAWGEA